MGCRYIYYNIIIVRKMKTIKIMKKYFLSIFAIIMTGIMGIAFVSCSKEDGDKEDNEESIVGTWMETQESGTKLYLILLPNGYGSWEVEQINGRIENDGEFTYTYKDNVITISYVDSNTVERYYVIGLTAERLTIKEDDGRKYIFYRN